LVNGIVVEDRRYLNSQEEQIITTTIK
jgi:hypothetical protein